MLCSYVLLCCAVFICLLIKTTQQASFLRHYISFCPQLAQKFAPFVLLMLCSYVLLCCAVFICLLIKTTQQASFLRHYISFCPQLAQKFAPFVLAPQFGQKLGTAFPEPGCIWG